MSPSDFLSELDPSRKAILSEIHRLIIETNKREKPEVEKVMGRQMIAYEEDGKVAYGLSSPKSHMSLYLMPIYGAKFRSKYEKLLNKADFQKAYINFKNKDDLPQNILRELLEDCSKVDFVSIYRKYHPESISLADQKKQPKYRARIQNGKNRAI